MAEEIKQVEDENQQPVEAKPKEAEKTTDIDARLKEIEANLESKYKSQIAGLDRKVSELTKEKEEIELSKLDDKTRAEEEIKRAQAEKDKILAETERIKLDRVIDKALFDSGLSSDLASRIQGNNENEVLKDVKSFKEMLDIQIQAGIEKEINSRLGGKSPDSDKSSAIGDLQALYNAAKKLNKKAEIIAIKRQAARENFNLNL